MNVREASNTNFYFSHENPSKAMILLSDSQKCKQFSIDAIAKEAGFKTISNFNSSFKKITGTTPSEFKQSANSQQVESLVYTD